MAICKACQREMHNRVSCTVTVFEDFGDKKGRARIPFGTETIDTAGKAKHCPDCLAPRGGFHHPGCDIEQCACCNGQAVNCGSVVEFRPTAEALQTVLDAYNQTHKSDNKTETLVYTDVYALGEYPVTSIFHWSNGADPLGWWFFAEEREVSPEILRVTPLQVLIKKDPKLAKMLQLAEGKKAFREGDSEEWYIQYID